MPSIEELGRKYKKKYPGIYDHRSDYDVGMGVKKKYPGKYDHYTDTSLSIETHPLYYPPPPPSQLEVIIDDLMTSAQRRNEKMIEPYAEGLDYYLDPHRGFFTAWFQNRKSVKRTELADNIGAEKLAIINQASQLAEGVRNGQRKEIEFKRFVLDNATVFLEIKAKANRITEADKLGISEPHYTQINADKLMKENESEHHITITTHDTNQRIIENKERVWVENDAAIELREIETDLRIKEFTEKNKVEWERYKNEANLDVQAAIISHITPVFEADALMTQLFKVIDGIQQLQLPGMDDSATMSKIRALKRTKKYLERCINERFERLLQGVSGRRKEFQEMEKDPQDTES